MSNPREWRMVRIAVAGADACVIALAFSVMYLSSPDVNPATPLVDISLHRALQLGICVVVWLITMTAYRLYNTEYLLYGVEQYGRVIQACTISMLMLVGLVALLDGNTVVPRTWLLTSWMVSIVALGSTRFLIRRLIWRLRREGRFEARTLIIGAGEDGLAIAEQLKSCTPDLMRIVGYLDEYSAVGAEVGGNRVLGEPLELARVVEQTGATDAIIVPQAITWESLQALLQGGAESWGLRQLWLAPAFSDLLTTGMEVHQRGSLPLLSVAGPRIAGLEGALKRSLDLALTLIVLPLALLVSLGVATWLVTIRRLPPLVCRRVIAGSRRDFTLYTFPPLPELQRWHVWRLPALLNVLRGDLSFVGPRPIYTTSTAEYRQWKVMLTSVRPGLIGPWWMLSGSRQLSIISEVMADLAYIRTYSIWSDIRLVAATIRRLTTRGGWIAPIPAPVDIERTPEIEAVPVTSTATTMSGGIR